MSTNDRTKHTLVAALGVAWRVALPLALPSATVLLACSETAGGENLGVTGLGSSGAAGNAASAGSSMTGLGAGGATGGGSTTGNAASAAGGMGASGTGPMASSGAAAGGGATPAEAGSAAGGNTTVGAAGAFATGGSPLGSGGGASGGAAGTGGAGGSSAGASSSTNDEPCPSSATLEAGDTAMSLTVGGNEYPFNVHAPPMYDGVTRLPVVFDFHGLGGDEDQMIRLSGWADTGDDEGFITVFPGGVDNAWNAGGCCSDTPTDVEFAREAVAHLNTVACIDTKRVYASGCSNGGAMSYRLACEASDLIAAVAPVDFDCVVGGGCGDCNPGRPVTEIQFRGTDDSLVPYSGAEPNFETWGEINECSGSPEPLVENSSCQRHTMCAEGVESILCTVQGGSHCGSYSSFGIAPLAWSIISQYSLP